MPTFQSFLSAALAVFSFSACAQTPTAGDPRYPLRLHVVGSVADSVFNLTGGLNTVLGRRLVVTVDGAVFMLQASGRSYPLPLGDYPARLERDENTGNELKRSYALHLPGGKEDSFFVVGMCERDATVCFGFSVPVERSPSPQHATN